MPIATPVMEDAYAQNVNPAQVGSATLGTATTSAQQLAGILNKGGPLMQQSATMGNSQAASRGLLNSSMGIQAAQSAMIGAAAPIAQTDASQLNNMSQFNAGAQNQEKQFNASNQQQANLANQQANNAMNQWNAGQQNQATLQAMDTNSRESLANIEANYKQLMQVNSSAESMYNQVLKNVADIQGNKDITDKQTAINSQLSWLRSGMQMVQNLNGISGLITF